MGGALRGTRSALTGRAVCGWGAGARLRAPHLRLGKGDGSVRESVRRRHRNQRPPLVNSSGAVRAINQCLPNLEYGDAISNSAIWIRDTLREFGFSSEIYVRYIDPRVEHQCRVFAREALKTSDAIIYHHSVGTEITAPVVEYTGPKCLVYHNITPPEFFELHAPGYAQVSASGA